MRKYVLIILLSVLINVTLFAQEKDVATMECSYRLSFLKDTTNNIYTEDLMVLRLNNEKSIFYSENSYTLDSLLCSDQGDKIRADLLANGFNKYGKRIISYNILKNFQTKKINFTDNVGGDHFSYQEDLPQFDWKLTKETKKILGYNCQKAVCEFRGRTYEAWFTKDISVHDGPWKFNGLPGLILEVYDLQKHYIFEFVGLRNSDANITMLSYQYIKTTREKYQKTYRNYIKDPVAYITAASGMKITLSKSTSQRMKARKRVKYNMMERD